MTALPVEVIATPEMNRRKIAKAKTRAKIIDAARMLFTEYGYAEVGIRTVAASINMSTGAIFANFESKDALWLEVMDAPVPDVAAADVLCRLTVRYSGWPIRMGWDGKGLFTAAISSPDYRPAFLGMDGVQLPKQGTIVMTKGEILSAALRDMLTQLDDALARSAN